MLYTRVLLGMLSLCVMGGGQSPYQVYVSVANPMMSAMHALTCRKGGYVIHRQ